MLIRNTEVSTGLPADPVETQNTIDRYPKIKKTHAHITRRGCTPGAHPTQCRAEALSACFRVGAFAVFWNYLDRKNRHNAKNHNLISKFRPESDSKLCMVPAQTLRKYVSILWSVYSGPYVYNPQNPNTIVLKLPARILMRSL
jgi:hypothetical protein